LALCEVGGDAVAYTEPDAPAIGRALTELLDDPARRAALGRAGQARAELFSWQNCAQAHVRAYQHAVEHRAAGRSSL
ncbi:MAG: glycosyltransferase family 1 protein, partial [Actinomycetota bacterium]|nr:glycosyltransferase family 1 protein [Actinomycetota bacterium]